MMYNILAVSTRLRQADAIHIDVLLHAKTVQLITCHAMLSVAATSPSASFTVHYL